MSDSDIELLFSSAEDKKENDNQQTTQHKADDNNNNNDQQQQHDDSRRRTRESEDDQTEEKQVNNTNEEEDDKKKFNALFKQQQPAAPANTAANRTKTTAMSAAATATTTTTTTKTQTKVKKPLPQPKPKKEPKQQQEKKKATTTTTAANKSTNLNGETDVQVSRRIGDSIHRSLSFEKYTVHTSLPVTLDKMTVTFFKQKVVPLASKVSPVNWEEQIENDDNNADLLVVAEINGNSKFHDLVGNYQKLKAGSMYGSKSVDKGVFLYRPKKQSGDLWFGVE